MANRKAKKRGSQGRFAHPVENVSRETIADNAVQTQGHDAWDQRSHIERINGSMNPAYVPGSGVVHARKTTP